MLSKQEVDLAVAKGINSLDDVVGESPAGPSPLVNYIDTVGVQNIKTKGVKGKIVRKTLAPFSQIIKKVFQGYFDQRTRVDEYSRDMLFMAYQDLSAHRAESLPKDELNNKFYETHKLMDGFKKEILAELVDIKGGNVGSKEKIKTQIVNKGRASKLKKVNIGSGRDIRDDYINLDHRAIEGVDVVADVMELPFKENSLTEIFASHLAEHFIQRDLTKIIRYWYSLLGKGGSIRLIVPNIDVMAKKYATTGEVTWEQLRAVALGGQDYASDYHFNHFSVASMEEFVKDAVPDAKFTVVEPARRNGECFEMEVLITKRK